MPYRIYVPTRWDGKRSLPIVLFLHGAGMSRARIRHRRRAAQLAEEHGYIVVSPLGFTPLGAYATHCACPPSSASRTAAAQRNIRASAQLD